MLNPNPITKGFSERTPEDLPERESGSRIDLRPVRVRRPQPRPRAERAVLHEVHDGHEPRGPEALGCHRLEWVSTYLVWYSTVIMIIFFINLRNE